MMVVETRDAVKQYDVARHAVNTWSFRLFQGTASRGDPPSSGRVRGEASVDVEKLTTLNLPL